MYSICNDTFFFISHLQPCIIGNSILFCWICYVNDEKIAKKYLLTTALLSIVIITTYQVTHIQYTLYVRIYVCPAHAVTMYHWVCPYVAIVVTSSRIPPIKWPARHQGRCCRWKQQQQQQQIYTKYKHLNIKFEILKRPMKMFTRFSKIQQLNTCVSQIY